MKVLLIGKVPEKRTDNRSIMESKVIDARRRYSTRHKEMMGDQRHSIIDSIQRRFEALSPNDAA